MTYNRKLRDHHTQDGKEIDDKVSQIVVCIMCAEQKKNDWNAEKELLGWSVLIAVIDLLPHVEVVVSTSVELEGHTANPVEHKKRAKHVGNIG